MDIIKARCLKLTEELEFVKLGIKTDFTVEKNIDNFSNDAVSAAIRGYLQELEELR